MSIPIGRMKQAWLRSHNVFGDMVESLCGVFACFIALYAQSASALQLCPIRFQGARRIAPFALRNKSLASYESRSMALVEGGSCGAARVDVCHAFEQ